jgi:hypothetical protein
MPRVFGGVGEAPIGLRAVGPGTELVGLPRGGRRVIGHGEA